MNTKKKNFKITCCDNAGKNKTLEENCVKYDEEIKFEFTSPGTPQKNGVAERGFATLYFCMQAMMVHSGLHEKLNTGLCPECVAEKIKGAELSYKLVYLLTVVLLLPVFPILSDRQGLSAPYSLQAT